MRSVLKLSAFRRLLVAYSFNELAFSFGSLALAVLVYRRTGSALGAAAFFLCAQFVPALISPVVVARIDKHPPRAVLPILYALEALAFLALARVASRFALVPVLALALADGIVAFAARAIARATTVAITSPRGLLREGNALTNSSYAICFMIGPAVAGLVVAASGIRTVLLVNSGLFWVMAITLASAKGLPGAAAEFGSVRERLRAAASQAWRRPPIRSLLSLQAAAILVFTISIPVEVVFAQHSLHVGAGGYGALLSVWGAGAVVGSVFYARWRRLSTRALITGSAGSLGVGFLLMAVAPSLFMALAGAALGGAGNGVEAVAERTALQEQVEPGWMALMMSINDSIFQIAPGGGIMLGGALTALSNPRVALAVAAGGALAVMGAAWIVLGPQRPAARERVASDPQRSRGTPEPATRR